MHLIFLRRAHRNICQARNVTKKWSNETHLDADVSSSLIFSSFGFWTGKFGKLGGSHFFVGRIWIRNWFLCLANSDLKHRNDRKNRKLMYTCTWINNNKYRHIDTLIFMQVNTNAHRCIFVVQILLVHRTESIEDTYDMVLRTTHDTTWHPGHLPGVLSTGGHRPQLAMTKPFCILLHQAALWNIGKLYTVCIRLWFLLMPIALGCFRHRRYTSRRMDPGLSHACCLQIDGLWAQCLSPSPACKNDSASAAAKEKLCPVDCSPPPDLTASSQCKNTVRLAMHRFLVICGI